ncbi:S1 family peptidase [Pseudobacteriovorax antillogorgiicola]|uniref:Trypsin n=1 Tax=Pseudobacteriovorax antillogorgiicola TaxID=1513793 RepID=A0A1Y6CEW6_9BACT|nr:S1 family peptidase [Pseudobacteriovorax antillogorgiicola]TCS47901.1 trypsin [Pseudobacteriovorax antillogorgiicola]SMF57792.1 Trypsin [Pseudobacteriovorax antillogorgiicola]
MRKEFRKTRAFAAKLGLCIGLAALFSCQKSDVESSRPNVINGVKESGFPAVGSLLTQSWFSRQHQCTATLIKPQWLLTAAHCVKNGVDKLVFAIGPEAKRGNTYSIERAIQHPRYYPNPVGSLYDIALVKLAQGVPSSVAEPILYSREAIEPLLGDDVLYLGYGSTSGESAILGLGIKRKVTLPISRIDDVTYSTSFEDKGLCTGDSGGPGLVQVAGELNIVGVTSASLGCQGGTCNICSNGTKHTRVDRFYDWIAAEVGDTFEPCSSDKSRCACDAACTAMGNCDDAVCAENTCFDMISCMFDECGDTEDGSCATACIDDGSIEARNKLMVLVDCWGSKCRAVPGSDNERHCLQTQCSDQWNFCSNN